VIFLKGPEKPKMNPRSYRPICLLNVISKFFEKIIINKLQGYRPGLADDKIQYGFREQKSTQDAINKFCTDAKETEGKYALAIYIDIKGAFVNLWWPELFINMKELNLPIWMIQVLRDYCRDRKVNLVAPGERLERTPEKNIHKDRSADRSSATYV